MAPQINADLIRDAMLSFGTADNIAVTEAQFCNIFDEGFDKSVSASVPNSRKSSAKAATAKQAVAPSEREKNSLIHKLDNAMLR